MTKEELTHAVKALAKGKSQGLDNFIVDFLKACWSIMSTNFTTTVNGSLT